MKPTGARLLQANSTNSGRSDQLSEETSKLFIYGTLHLDDVISILINRIPRYLVAKAPGWRIVHLPQKVYPGLVPDQGEAKEKYSPTSWTLSGPP